MTDDRPSDSPPGEELPTATSAPSRASLPSIGPFRLLHRLGAGGMGEVWEAEQERPVRRRVALKLLRPGFDSAHFLARFESERQALALMNHPHIARVFDAGTTDDGRPFLVMELVVGCAITEHCDRLRLPLAERVELFIGVCEGVQHAHQRGILHRDLKPSNVLVTQIDGEAVPKVIDFGLAKAVAQPLTDHPSQTRLGQLLGTPEFMSPEQADSSGLDVDTRSDVYSLGVLLYLLLAGLPPFTRDGAAGASLAEFLRQLRELDPPPPSARLAAAGEVAQRVAQARRTSPSALVGALRGDLDWIIARAMEKDRSRRYASPAELADDLRRHLRDQPVEASPPSLRYRAGKFVRRHRLAVVAALLIASALVVGGVGTLAGLVRARQAEAAARHEAATARRVSSFLIDLFEVAGPEGSLGETITARELLERGARAIRQDLSEDPLVRARLLDTIGDVHRKLGLFREAALLLEEALAVRREHPATSDEEIEQSLLHVGAVRSSLGQLDAARTAIVDALARRERRLGARSPLVGEALGTLGVLEYQAGDYAAAHTAFDRALVIHEASYGADSPQVARTVDTLGVVLDEQGRHDEARSHYQRALRILERELGPTHPDLAAPLSNLALNLKSSGRGAEARPLYERALAIDEKVLGPDHADLATTLQNLAALDLAERRDAAAEQRLNRALAIRAAALGDEHPQVAFTLDLLAELYWRRGDYAQADRHVSRAIELRERALGRDHPTLAVGLRLRGSVAWKLGRPAVARESFERSLAIQRAVSGNDGLEVGRTLAHYGCFLAEQPQRAAARPMLDRALQVLPDELPEALMARHCRAAGED